MKIIKNFQNILIKFIKRNIQHDRLLRGRNRKARISDMRKREGESCVSNSKQTKETIIYCQWF